MDSNTRKKFIKLVADKLTAAFEQVTLKEAREYHVSLGNFNEIHLIKNDATKSVFMGRVFETLDDNISVEDETKKIWMAIANYFKSSNNQNTVAPKVEETKEVATAEKTTKKATTKANTKAPLENVNAEVDAKYSDDDDSNWVDTVI